MTVPTPVEVESVGLREREADRVARIADLERQLNVVLEEKAVLESELAMARERRKALEAELEKQRSSGDSRFTQW